MKLVPKIVDKPWGSEEWLVVCEKYAFKVLNINKGHRCSLQYHEKKEESWLLSKGRLLVRFGDEEFEMAPGDVVHVPPGTVHRLLALEDAKIVEVSTPELDDVVRLSDDYKRV